MHFCVLMANIFLYRINWFVF